METKLPFCLSKDGAAWREKIKPLVLRFEKGQMIHEQGACCVGMEYVLAGKIAVCSLAPNGAESVVFEFSKGSSIGANLLFGLENRYPLSIRCTEGCQLLRLSKSDVEALLHDYGFVMEFIHCISRNAQGLKSKMINRMQKTLRENLLEYFQMLRSQQGTDTVTLPMSKKRMADYFSVQRPSLFRELKKMKEEGQIAVDGDRVTLL